MIMPTGFSIRSLTRSPFTLILFGLNVFIFCIFFVDASQYEQRELTSEDLQTAGRLYVRQGHAERVGWMREITSMTPEMLEIIGGVAVRSDEFSKRLRAPEGASDDVAVGRLREQVEKFRERLRSQPLYRFGLNPEQSDTMAWFTYQFSHGSWWHLLSNMIFLLVFGLMVERIAGSLAVVGVYLVGGILGGWACLAFNPGSLAPVVGASASVSALIGFYLMVEKRRNVRGVFLLLPLVQSQVFTHIPVWFVAVLFLLSDVAAILSQPSGLMGPVAYAAHVGGAGFGLLAGLACRILIQTSRVEFEIDEV